MDGLSPIAVAVPKAFATDDTADVVVVDERTCRISHVPILPHETVKPGYEYPTTMLPEDAPWRMRRYIMLVKHDPTTSKMADYVVVRDEIHSPQSAWQNLHVLARSIEPQGEGRYFFPGQLDVDLTVHVCGTTPDRTEQRLWGWGGNSSERRTVKGSEYEAKYLGHVIPENFRPGTWDESSGEQSQWLRLRAPQGRTIGCLCLRRITAVRKLPTWSRLVRIRSASRWGKNRRRSIWAPMANSQAAVRRRDETTRLLQGVTRGEIAELEK